MEQEFFLSGWQGASSGLRVDAETRRKVFLPLKDRLHMVQVILPGHETKPCSRLTPTFWTSHPVLRSAEIGRWMEVRGDKPWHHRRPPKYRATLVVGNVDTAKIHVSETAPSEGMRTFKTPEGRAGLDQIYGMTESVQAELEQMFWQRAKLDALLHGVGRSAHSDLGGDSSVRLDAQRRECQAQVTFHAGRALELSMHIVYACSADRIMGRSHPGSTKKQLRQDRQTHSLLKLYKRILCEVTDRDMCDALEDVYLEALHKGVIDLELDGELQVSLLGNDDRPFLVDNMRKVIDGVEMTLDHVDLGHPLSSGEQKISKFQEMPLDTFDQFLKKTDAAYYADDIWGQRKNMRWAHYSARDHEYGRPYVVAGSKFFARLVRGLVELSSQQWTWHPDFRRRWHERRRYNVARNVRVHISQSFQGDVALPEMKSVEQMESFFQQVNGANHLRTPDEFSNLHQKFSMQRKYKGNSA